MSKKPFSNNEWTDTLLELYDEARKEGKKSISFADVDKRLAEKRKPKTENDFRKEIATFLHMECCSSNHIDECDWEYDDTWMGYAKPRYLKIAEKIIEKVLKEKKLCQCPK